MIKRAIAAFVVVATIGSTSEAQQRRLEVGLESGGSLINDVDQSTVAMHPATPYIESSTLMLADVDLEKLDIEATGKWLAERMGGPNDDPAAAMLRGFIDSMKGAGAKHLFATGATRSVVDRGPVVVVPCENSAVVSGLLTALLQNIPANPAPKVHVGEKIVLAGSATAVDRVTVAEGVSRPDLILPLKRGERLDHTLVISLPDEARRDLAALWPDRMPEESPLQFSPRLLAADISQIVVSLRLPPDPLILAEVEAPDAGAAARVKEVLEKAIALGGDMDPPAEISVEIATVKLRASPEVISKVVMAIASPSRQRATRMMTMNDMRQIGLAIHNYFGKEKHLPPRCFTDANGKPLLSVRVALLPYLEQEALYNALKLDQVWNSEDNARLSSFLVPVFCDDPSRGAKTTIRFPVYPGSAWHGEGPPKSFRDVTDGTSNTIAAIDAPDSAAIEWANPEPWALSVDDPMSDVFGDRELATVLMFDGAALVLKKSEMTNEKLKAMLTIAGGESLD